MTVCQPHLVAFCVGGRVTGGGSLKAGMGGRFVDGGGGCVVGLVGTYMRALRIFTK